MKEGVSIVTLMSVLFVASMLICRNSVDTYFSNLLLNVVEDVRRAVYDWPCGIGSASPISGSNEGATCDLDLDWWTRTRGGGRNSGLSITM